MRVDPVARERIAAANALVRRAVADGHAIYGVTTGLGARVTETIAEGAADAGAYSRRTIRGRATAVGEPLNAELTRAAMAVRLNGLCAGGAGVEPAVADALAALLNHGVHPEIPRSGSVGAADLCLMAHVGLGLIGEGRAELDGEWLDGAQALARAGLAPLELGPRDGLAICSSSAVAIGAAALALVDGQACLAAVQASAALALEGFRANLSPLDPRVVAARPAPGQAWAAAGLRELLAGGALEAGDEPPRRLQDPLSFRCASQVHGSLRAALELLESALAPELSGAADNPLVVPEGAGNDDAGAVLPTGNFSSPALALALDAVAIALAQVAHGIAERTARLTEARLSGLTPGLAPEATTRSGMAPLSKTAHALELEIRHLAAPLSIHAMVLADGVEDDTTGATQAALRLGEQLSRLRLLAALELLVSAQAVDAAGVGARLGTGTGAAHRCVRELVPPLAEDRPLGTEVRRIADGVLATGALAARIASAASPAGATAG